MATLIELIAGRRGHFRMESGLHSEAWFELDGLFRNEELLAPHLSALADKLRAYAPQVICGPVTGGARVAAEVARILRVEYAYADRVDTGGAGLFPIRYCVPATARAALRGKRVAIVDDAISAGSAVRGTYADLVELGAIPVALGALILFGNSVKAFAESKGLAIETVERVSFRQWRPDECPLCRENRPLETAPIG